MASSFLSLSLLWRMKMLRAKLALCGNIGFTCLRHQLLTVCAVRVSEHAYNEARAEKERAIEGKRSSVQ